MNTKGYLKVHCFINDNYIPAKNAKIIIYKSDANFNDLNEVLTTYTNESGFVDNIELETPPLDLSYTSNTLPYGIYNIHVIKEGLKELKIKGIQVFPTVKAIQNCNLEPGCCSPCSCCHIIINEHKHVSNSCSKNPKECASSKSDIDNFILTSKNKKSKKYAKKHRVLDSVVVPSYIIVHAGSPFNSSAPNYKVPFIDYIKNVACSELYSTWNSSCLRANIYCIVSFALNRIYTEWYPSQGYSFDITNDTPYVT